MSEQLLMRAKSVAIRARCQLLGCEVSRHIPACGNCGAGLYDDFVQYGKLDPIFRFYWRTINALRKLGPRKCKQCGKKYRRGYNEYLCSEECHDNWLPF